MGRYEYSVEYNHRDAQFISLDSARRAARLESRRRGDNVLIHVFDNYRSCSAGFWYTVDALHCHKRRAPHVHHHGISLQ